MTVSCSIAFAIIVAIVVLGVVFWGRRHQTNDDPVVQMELGKSF